MMGRRSNGGFTLLEIIAVLAIISIMASLITPNLVQSVANAKRRGEAETLSGLAAILKQVVVENQVIPDSITWDSAVAANASLPMSQITFNDAGYPRLYIAHPAFFDASAGLPARGYVQATALQTNRTPATVPAKPRILMVSSLSRNPPSSLVSATLFDQIWSQAGQPAEWTESPSLILQRVDLGECFFQQSFSRDPASRNNPVIVIGAYSRTLRSGTGQATFSAFFLKGTTINFYDGANELENTQITREARSYTYKSPDWIGTWD